MGTHEPDSAILQGKRILVAEDNMLNLIIARKVLEGWGIEFDIVENGQKALEAIQEKDYHIIIMDIQMPVLNGFEASMQIRSLANETINKIPIIALTASVSDELESQIQIAGMNGLILKPYTSQALRDIVCRYIA